MEKKLKILLKKYVGGLATNSVFTTVENKIPTVDQWRIWKNKTEKKYITRSEYHKFTKDIRVAKIWIWFKWKDKKH